MACVLKQNKHNTQNIFTYLVMGGMQFNKFFKHLFSVFVCHLCSLSKTNTNVIICRTQNSTIFHQSHRLIDQIKTICII